MRGGPAPSPYRPAPAPPFQALTQLDGGAAARGASAGAASEARLAVEMPELHALALALAAGQQP